MWRPSQRDTTIHEGMSMRIFVGNLAVPITEDDLRQLFEPYGAVDRVQILADQATGEAQGFVEMPDATEAQAALDGLQGATLGGRTLTVNEARQREEPRPRGEHPRGPRW